MAVGSVLLTGARPLGTSALVDVLVRDGRVAAVTPHGSRSSAGAVEHVALGGRTLMRGLRDGHVHLNQWAMTLRRIDLSAARSAAEVVRLVQERVRTDPPPAGAALVAYGFRDGLWPNAPTAALLDDALERVGARDTPVVLVSGDYHCAWLSTAALVRHGVVGHPTGVLREREWFAISEAAVAVPEAVLDDWVDQAVRGAAARGVTQVVDFELADNLTAWRRRMSGTRPTDGVRVAASAWPEYLDRPVAEELATGDVVGGTGGLLTMGPLKVITDGSLNTRTAYCHDPYPGLGAAAGSHGVLSVPPEELRLLMAKATRHGLACAIHAIGDHANALALDAFEATGARGSIEHAQLVSRGDLTRFAALGVVASIQPEHALDDRDVADRYWVGRTHRAFAYAALHDAGVTLALGSDAPVAPLDPWLAIAAAVHRTRDGREPWHPEQGLSLDVALAASAGGRAEVAVGDVADLVVLDADPSEVDAAGLRAMPVAGTLVAGRWTWDGVGR
ncbi:amidohydrolase family protein [Cellulomonas fimi]|uniref:amidohydrolase n=1 Tax=Cellulomonas fimi TaxID=1708 RepID=UPI0028934E5B|nr:amidohydrolase family protein [Cellulomonas fimi]